MLERGFEILKGQKNAILGSPDVYVYLGEMSFIYKLQKTVRKKLIKC